MNTYKSHIIKQDGWILGQEVDSNGKVLSFIIPPNTIVVKHKEEIENDYNFKRYRTPENATAYEQATIDSQLTEQERLDQWRQSASLSRRRFKIGEALYQVNGTPLVQLIEALLAGLTEPTKTVATISYEQSGSFDRLDPFILQFSQALGMSDEETDDFFKYCLDEGWNNID